MRKWTYTAHIEKDEESGLYYGYVPSLPGAHTQAEDIATLHVQLEEVVMLCLEELTDEEKETTTSKFLGTHQVSVSV